MKKLFSIKIKFILFNLLLFGLLLFIAFQFLPINKLVFVSIEIAILLLMVFAIHLYKSFITPINLISEGVEVLKTKDFNMKFRSVGQYELDNLIDVYNEMIETLRLKQVEMEKQNYFLEQLVKSSPTGIIIFDKDDKVLSINPIAEKITGFSSDKIIGSAISEIQNDIFQQMDKLIDGASIIIKSSGINTYKCTRSQFFDKGFPHNFIIIEELTQELLKTERNAYGKIIRMMSHEINNSVGSVNSIINSALTFLQSIENNEKSDYENALTVAIERNQRLNKFMANFAEVARLPMPNKTQQNLVELLKSVRTQISSMTNKDIKWITDYSDEKITINFDIQQMEVVISNIMKNAVEAIENSGEIRISLQNKRLVIANNGQPIDPQIKAKLFTPFFSTKETGQGIGLTLTRDILMNHGFGFSLETKVSGYTEFVIEFY